MSQCNVLMIWGWEVVLCREVEIDLSHRGMATKFHFSAIPCPNIYYFSQSFIGQSKPTFIISSQLFKRLYHFHLYHHSSPGRSVEVSL